MTTENKLFVRTVEIMKIPLLLLGSFLLTILSPPFLCKQTSKPPNIVDWLTSKGCSFPFHDTFLLLPPKRGHGGGRSRVGESWSHPEVDSGTSGVVLIFPNQDFVAQHYRDAWRLSSSYPSERWNRSQRRHRFEKSQALDRENTIPTLNRNIHRFGPSRRVIRRVSFTVLAILSVIWFRSRARPHTEMSMNRNSGPLWDCRSGCPTRRWSQHSPWPKCGHHELLWSRRSQARTYIWCHCLTVNPENHNLLSTQKSSHFVGFPLFLAWNCPQIKPFSVGFVLVMPTWPTLAQSGKKHPDWTGAGRRSKNRKRFVMVQTGMVARKSFAAPSKQSFLSKILVSNSDYQLETLQTECHSSILDIPLRWISPTLF